MTSVHMTAVIPPIAVYINAIMVTMTIAWTTSIPVMNSSTSDVAYSIAADVSACDTRKITEMTDLDVGPKRRSWYS